MESCLILTVKTGNVGTHALLLTTDVGDQIAIRSGFASGYGGEGPKGFAKVLALLDWQGVEIDEVLVSQSIINAIDTATLTPANLKKVESQKPVRPKRLWDYIVDPHYRLGSSNPWRNGQVNVPLSIFDDRLSEPARDFWTDPDGTLLKAYRLLEHSVRQKAGVAPDETKGAASIFARAFNGDNAPLTWGDVSKTEREGLANLFVGFAKAYRNARTHTPKNENREEQLRELLLVNQLFLLEDNAIQAGEDSND